MECQRLGRMGRGRRGLVVEEEEKETDDGGGVERLVLRQWLRATASSLLTSAGTETGSGPVEV